MENPHPLRAGCIRVADTVLFEFVAVGVMGAALALTAWRKRGFVMFVTLAMFVVTGLEFLFKPAGLCTFPDLSWRFIYLGEPLQYYRLFTSLFVHDACGGAHIVGNAFTLILLGYPLEEKIGWKLTAVIFFLTGIVGALLSSAFVLAVQDPVWSNAYAFGASGSIFGLIAYFAVRYPREQVWAPLIVIIARVPISIAAVAALVLQALILTQISSPFVGQLPWPSVLAHVTSFGVGMIITRVPGLRSADTPKERAFHLDLSPLRELVVKPAEKMEVEAIIKEDIPEVAQAKLESFMKRARCPKCQGVLELRGKGITSDCGWSLEFGRRPAGAPRK